MATKDELLEQAAELEIEGRSSMNKAELEHAIIDAGGSASANGETDPDAWDHEKVQAARGRPNGLRYREDR